MYMGNSRGKREGGGSKNMKNNLSCKSKKKIASKRAEEKIPTLFPLNNNNNLAAIHGKVFCRNFGIKQETETSVKSKTE